MLARILDTDTLPIRHKCNGRVVATLTKNAPPGLAEKGAMFTASIKRHVASGQPLLQFDQIESRLEICKACPQFNPSGSCNLCGCRCNGRRIWLNKLALPLESCPDKPPRWEAAG
jgi:hypothetical protein